MPKVSGSATKFKKFRRVPSHAAPPTVSTTPPSRVVITAADAPRPRVASSTTRITAPSAPAVARKPSVSSARSISAKTVARLAVGSSRPSARRTRWVRFATSMSLRPSLGE